LDLNPKKDETTMRGFQCNNIHAAMARCPKPDGVFAITLAD